MGSIKVKACLNGEFSCKLHLMKFSIDYHKKWLIIGLVVGFLNMLAGLVLGAGMWTDPKLEKEGKIVVIFSLVWGMVALLIIRRFAPL